MDEEEFVPQLGKMRSRGLKAQRKYAHQVLVAINRAGGRHVRKGYSGKRFGRGGATGIILAGRDRFSSFRERRVMVKVRVVKLAGKGMDGAKAHVHE